MIRVNEGTLDRSLRITVGAVMLYLGLGGVVTGAAGTVLSVLAVLPLLTGLFGWCPLYALLGIRTTGRNARGSAAT